MGYGLTTYRIAPSALVALPSIETPAFARIERRLGRRFAALRESFADEIAEGELRDPSAALAALARGKAKRDDAMCGAVVEALVAVLGKALAPGVFERFSSAFFSDLDDELTARGLEGKDAMVRIVQSGVPAFGKRFVQPECGYMPPDQVARVGALLDRMDVTALDADQRSGARTFRAWIRAAEKHAQGLAIFST